MKKLILSAKRKPELWSLFFLGIAFIVFTIGIPLLQERIDSVKDFNSLYRFNLQQSLFKHSKFISIYDNGYFLDILLQENIIPVKHRKAVFAMQDRLTLRCQENLADAIMSASVDPSDPSTDDISRFAKLRSTSIDGLMKEWDKYTNPEPTKIGHKFAVEINFYQKFKNIMYCIGSLFFILGTFFQFLSNNFRQQTNSQ